ncbi:hypothetical protein L0436_004717 [Salmonella enterica]|nr:hypothetical protein [Salmonella enterica subsp. enterica serovar Oranienburg]EAA7484457.1 hypothetical protein [Salmonella enterica subsp. enterica serovar Irumu]EAQ5680237.1 hypothetical protein [Salmonella enterica]ECT9500476.1 hypothetical protein [Salmonella enterica subsp. enterica serovar Infantis]MKV95169.1 hypothetical protein [Salmonella enterica subsp. enterica serovar Fresno]
MIQYLLSNIDKISTFITAVAALLTTVATFFLWRVTRVLANETKRMVDASQQPQVVATLEPNAWSMHYFDISVANTGNAPAFNIEVAFDPPLENSFHRKNKTIPLRQISVLRNGQIMTSNLCEYHQIEGKVFQVNISWTKKPNATVKEIINYTYDMASFSGISQLGAKNPMTVISQQIKEIREDWKHIAKGKRRIQTDIYDAKDRGNEKKLRDEGV